MAGLPPHVAHVELWRRDDDETTKEARACVTAGKRKEKKREGVSHMGQKARGKWLVLIGHTGN